MTDSGGRDGYEVAVIGGGTAGMTVAKLLAREGVRVALIEEARTGGDCLYTGCVPSKALIATAGMLATIRRAGDFGVRVGEPKLDLPAAIARKNRIIDEIGVVDSPAALAEAGVAVLSGHAEFVDATRIRIEERTLDAERVVIATGSRPTTPSIPGLTESGFVTSDELMELTTLPRRLAVIGAGATGLELGQTFARFGSEVTVVDRSPRVLWRDDAEAAEVVMGKLRAEGISFRMGREVERVDGGEGGKRLTLRADSGGPSEIEVDEILVAVGRTPRIGGLRLDAAGVALDGDAIRVDERFRTSSPTTWACGDVTGPPYYTHAAEDQARTVAKNVQGGKSSWSGRALPWATFTDPEIAGVGLTEEAARAKHGDKLEVLRFPYEHLDRAMTDGRGDGFVKVLLAPGGLREILGGEVVGAHAVGANAAEIVQQFAVLMAWRLPAGILAKVVQAYPTYSLAGRQTIGLHWQNRRDDDSSSGPVGVVKSWLTKVLER